MPQRLLDDSNYREGVIKEFPSWELPEGALADASNMIFDIPGIARQRCGTAALSALGAQTAFATSLGFVYSQDATLIEELYGVNGKTGAVGVVNKATGAVTNVATSIMSGYTFSRPVRHFGFTFWGGIPPVGSSQRYAAYVAGQTSSTTFTSTTAVTFTAGQQQVTLGGADVTTNLKVGAIVFAVSGSAGYFGRVVSIDSSTKFTVWPAPNTTFTTGGASGVTAQPSRDAGGGTCGCSFQNRLLWGNTNDLSSTGQTLVDDRRIYYSTLPNETSLSVASVTYSGAAFVNQGNWPVGNWIDVPGADPIIAMEPVNDNELLILTSGSAVIFRGVLATQTANAATGITFDLSPMNTTAGCLSDLSVQRTPRGIIWASADGIMLYTGSSQLTDLTAGRYHTAWRSLTRGSSFAVHGSAYVRNHYIVSGTSAGSTFVLAINMETGAFAPLSSALDLFYAVPRPTDATQAFALRWWDQTGTAPSFTNGQVNRFESVFAPDTAGSKVDADNSAVPFSITSRTLTGDGQVEQFVRQLAVRAQVTMQGGATGPTVSVGARVDSTDTAGTPTVQVGVLSSTAALTISGQTNATPIVISTFSQHGLQSGDQVDIHGCTPNTNANGRWYITVLSTTSFSLNASIGNGATSATGTYKRVTEQEFAGTAVDIGQGHYVVISSNAQTIFRFELHALRVQAMQFGHGIGRYGRYGII